MKGPAHQQLSEFVDQSLSFNAKPKSRNGAKERQKINQVTTLRDQPGTSFFAALHLRVFALKSVCKVLDLRQLLMCRS
jgi:hypothetical protein